MLTLEEIVKKLEDRNLSEVGRRAGVTSSYLSAILRGDRVNPTYTMLKKLSDYFNENP